MKKALNKDIFRTIWKEKKRFISIMLITVLGVTVMTGLSAGCMDLRMSADRFFDKQELFDVSVMSTLGLTEEDVDVLRQVEGVEEAEGFFSEIVHTKRGEVNKTAEVKVVKNEGLNLPYVVEGTLPKAAGEIAVTKNYMSDTNKKVGDTVEIEELLGEDEETPNFPYTTFTITGVVIDVMDINNAEGSAGFRATPNADYTFFLTEDSVDSEVYTAIYLVLSDADSYLCYSKEYEDKVSVVISQIEEQIMEQREQARYDEITGEAYEKIDDAEKEMLEEFAEAEEEFADAEKEISDGWTELEDGRKELADKEAEVAQEIEDARKEVEEGYKEIADAEKELEEAWGEIGIGMQQLAEGKQELISQEEAANTKLKDARELLKSKVTENAASTKIIDESIAGIKAIFGEEWTKEDGLSVEWNAYVSAAEAVLLPLIKEQMNSGQTGSAEEMQNQILTALNQDANFVNAQNSFFAKVSIAINNMQNPTLMQGQSELFAQLSQLAIVKAQVNATKTVLDAALKELDKQEASAKEQFAAAWEAVAAGERELEHAKAKLGDAQAEIDKNRKKLDDAVLEINENEQTAQKEFADARKELEDGEAELLDGEEELALNREEFEEKKKEAEDEIADARDEVNDIDMTQWYVQDRTSLSGYVNVQTDADCIESLASVFSVVFFVVAILISLTTVTRMVEEERGLIGTYKALGFKDREIRKKYVCYALFASVMGGLLGELGGFVILPEILFVFFDVMYMLPAYYVRMEPVSGITSVLLFIIGITGAAYVACHAELKHTPAHLMRPKAPKMGSRVFLEYITPLWKRLSFLNKVTARNLFRYKKRFFMTVFGITGCTALLMFGFSIKDSVSELMPMQYEEVYRYDLLAATNAEDNHKLVEYMENSEEITEFLNIQVESIKLKNAEGEAEKVQMMIFPDNASFEKYLTLENRDYESVSLGDDGIWLTENAAKMLELEVGEKVFIQKVNLEQNETVVADVVKNYLGNNVYLSQSAYEKIFEEYEPNGVLANLSDTCMNPIGFSDTLSEEDWILSSISTEELKDGFSAAFTLINIVVYVVLILAAGLAFVVLFTLASVNISERVRELATIKVLGFFDREVHSYVNKESLILTGIGIILGLPVGAAMSSTLTEILNMPAIYFEVTIYTRSYFFSAGLAILFAFLVQFLTDRTLNVIEPAEALKSVE